MFLFGWRIKMNSYGMTKNIASGIKDAIDDFADAHIRVLEELWKQQDIIKDAIEYIKESQTIDDKSYEELLTILGEYDR